MRLLNGYAKPIIALAITPDGSRLFSAAEGQTTIWQWDLASGKVTGKLRCNFSHRGVHALAVSPRGDFLVSASEASGVGYWPLDGGEPRQLDVGADQHDTTSFNPGLAVHPNRQVVATSIWRRGTGSGFQTWDLDDGDRHTVRAGHDRYVDSIGFSPDGGLVATASQDGTVRLWAFDGGEGLHVLRPRVGPTRVVFRPDGKALAVSGSRSVFVFDVRAAELLAELIDHRGNFKGLGYSPDGKYLASAALDGVVILRDATTNAVVGQRHLDLGKLTSMIWRADSAGLFVGGEKLIAVCELGELLVKETPKKRGEPLSLAGHTGRVEGLSYSRDGRTLACWTRNNTWRFWDLSAGAGQAKDCTHKSRLPFGNPGFVSWSPDSARVALSSTLRGYLGDPGTGAVANVTTPPETWLRHLAYTPSGRLFLAITAPAYTERWTRFELRDGGGEQILSAKQLDLPNSYVEVTHSAFSPDERRVYAAFPRNGVYRWTPHDGELVQLFEQSSQITAFAVRDDERLALTTGGNTAFVWSLPNGKKLLELKHALTCSGAAFLPGERIITTSYDGVVRIWDATGGTELHAFELGMGKVYCLAVSPDHMTFAAGVQKKWSVVLMDVPE